jgi:predicted enzyme related to lactoylglutathione lyase
VAPAGSDAVIAICPPGPDTAPGGKQTGITLLTHDIDAAHAQLEAAGADVDAEVSRFGEGVPPLFWFRDPEGNTLQVAEGS